MKIVQRALTLTACIAILAGCGGGGSKATAVPQPLSSAAAAAAAPKGTLTLTLRFPANFHHARFPAPAPIAVMVKGKKTYRTVAAKARPKTTAAKATQPAAAARRTPQYVNPTSGNMIFVSGYSFTYGAVQAGSATLPSNAQADGTQVISANLPADYYSYIAVQETDSTGTNELAYGVANYQQIYAASGNSLAITMDMNAQYIALTTDPVAGADATVLTNDGNTPFCSYNTGRQAFYAFAADSTGGYVLPGTQAGGAFDYYNNELAIPTPVLQPGAQYLAATPLGIQSNFNEGYETTNAAFLEINPDQNFSNQSYGYAVIGDMQSYPCNLGASFGDPNPSAYEPDTMTITGGNAPYTVTDTDDPPQCTVASTALSYQWTITPQASGITCTLQITDKNVGNSYTAYLSSNDPQSNPLTVTPTSIILQNQTEMDTIQISGGTPPYMYTYSGDTSVWQVINPMATSFTIQAGPNYNASCQTMDVTDSNDGDVTFSAGNCSF